MPVRAPAAHSLPSVPSPEQKTVEMGRYKHLRSQCAWEVVEKQAMVRYFESFEEYSAAQFILLGHETQPDTLGPPTLDQSIERCRKPLPDGSTLLIDRIGVTSHAGAWIGYYWENVGRSAEYAPADITIAFTGAVDGDGVVIGYPPLDMHHLHVGEDLESTLMFQISQRFPVHRQRRRHRLPHLAVPRGIRAAL
jgi:hypothetical protein